MIANQESFFPKDNTARYGSARQHRSLFLPKYLERDSYNTPLMDEAFERAYEIISKWADLESLGKLQKKKETALRGEFLTEVFGEALGYTLFSENETQWNIEPEFFVNGGSADAAIGLFEQNTKRPPIALIELKGPKVNLDRDRFAGRTAVQQCWDYLNAVPQCPWGIVCNYVSIRLYHREHSARTYQLFVLQELRRKPIFQQFYYIFQRGGFIPSVPGQIPRAAGLLKKTGERQKEVGDELYNEYHRNRAELIQHLTGKKHQKILDRAIRISQKLIDRIIFVAFCEDRGLLPADSIQKAYSQLPPFARVTNPRWQNFLDLFRSIDKGNQERGISPYNGGLFEEDPEVDGLNLDDKWTGFFSTVSRYDFREEVNVDVLGHLFEKSINDVARIRLGGLFEIDRELEKRPKMLKSAERKRFGIYYTPPQFTSFIVHNTVQKVIKQRFSVLANQKGIDLGDFAATKPESKRADYWRECLENMRQIKIVDPACGSGAFLIKAYDVLEEKYQDVIERIIFHDGNEAETLLEQIPDFILNDNLFGVDLSQEAVEITQLALWIRSARAGKSLTDLSQNIVRGNSLVSDPDVQEQAMVWDDVFHDVFSRENRGFDCVIGNPPWERMKLQEREFFDVLAPEIASAVSAASRRRLIEDLETGNPELYERYATAKDRADRMLDFIRNSGRFPLTGKGDINTYATFAELAYNIVASNGRIGLLVPSGIASDHTTKDFFGDLINNEVLIGLYDFENRKKIFPDVDGRFKFSVLLYGGNETVAESANFVFFAHSMEELQDTNRQIALSADEMKLLNPNTRTCPIFRTRRDAELTKSIYRRVPVLVNENRKEGGNPWGVRFLRMFDQTNDAELFKTGEELKATRHRRRGPHWVKGKKVFLPLYEAKMVQIYDHRAASVVVKDANWMRQGQTVETAPVEHQNPEFTIGPRWWVDKDHVIKDLRSRQAEGFLGFKDITSATNTRTMIAAVIPLSGVTNHFPLILTQQSTRLNMCLLANLNSFVFDFVVRQKIGGVTLNFFIVRQLPVFPPSFFKDRCPWSHRQKLESWISDRVLKLTCTSNDMQPLAEAAEFDPPVYRWKPTERLDLQAQLDAAYFILYEISREDVEYILSTFSSGRKKADDMFGGAGIRNLILKHYDNLLEKTASSP